MIIHICSHNYFFLNCDNTLFKVLLSYPASKNGPYKSNIAISLLFWLRISSLFCANWLNCAKSALLMFLAVALLLAL
nr:MAG TPA: hypothetical protein [Caudoviricetes sp.]